MNIKYRVKQSSFINLTKEKIIKSNIYINVLEVF